MSDAAEGATGPAVYLEAASAEDVEVLAALERSASLHPWTPEHFAAALRGEAGERVVVLRATDGEAIGFLVWQEVADEAHVHNVAIRPDHRRKGLARRLLGSCLALAGRRQARRAFLDVRAGNQPARALYRGLGFLETGSRVAYYSQPSEDAVLMEAEIRPDRVRERNLEMGEARVLTSKTERGSPQRSDP
jgi:[ribosomal protein S18]-alanine N-acetyltransferase